ncbi:MAG: hypothetical protein AB7P35_17675 [Hyphomonadaceae bacterium]
MDPGTLALLATAASVGSSVVQGLQAYGQGKHEAEIAGMNAKTADENARRARLDAALEEEAQRRALRMELGRAASASAQSGAQGGGMGKGSYAALNTQSARLGELDALNIRYAGETRAHASEVEAAQFRAERKAALMRAKSGLISGVLGAASAGLSGVSNYGGKAPRTAPRGTKIGKARTPSPGGVGVRRPSPGPKRHRTTPGYYGAR